MIFSILKKDLLINLSYRSAFIAQFLLIIIQLFIFYFLSKYIDVSTNKDEISISYFTYVIFSICFIDIMVTITNHFPREIMNLKTTGIFEEIVIMKANFFRIIIGMVLYPFVISSIKLIFYFIIASILQNELIIAINLLPQLIATSLLLMLSFTFISVIAGAYSIAFSKPGLIPILFITFSIIMGEAYFPLKLVPYIDGTLSFITSFSPAIENLRMLTHANINEDKFLLNLFLIISLCLAYFIISIVCINASIRYAKKNGSLLQY